MSPETTQTLAKAVNEETSVTQPGPEGRPPTGTQACPHRGDRAALTFGVMGALEVVPCWEITPCTNEHEVTT